MSFAHADLPLACLTPVSSGCGSSVRSRSPMAVATPVTVPLYESIPAITAVMNAVLNSRVRAGDAYLTACSAPSTEPVDLARLLRMAPRPALTVLPLPAEHYGDQYAFGLEPHKTIFDAATPPHVSVQDYVSRIITYGAVSSTIFITALIYIDRAAQMNPSLFITSLNVHRLLITAFVLATKFHEDAFYSMTFFSRLAGVPVSELNDMEMALLQAMNWSCSVNPEQFEHAESAFMGEAFDSPWGLSVYETLRRHEIWGVHHAFSRATTWTQFEVTPYQNGKNMTRLVSSPSGGGLGVCTGADDAADDAEDDAAEDIWAYTPESRSERRRKRRIGRMGAMAVAQAQHDYPGIMMFPTTFQELERANAISALFSEPGLRRFYVLRAMALGLELASTELPPLDPSPYLQSMVRIPALPKAPNIGVMSHASGYTPGLMPLLPHVPSYGDGMFGGFGRQPIAELPSYQSFVQHV